MPSETLTCNSIHVDVCVREGGSKHIENPNESINPFCEHSFLAHAPTLLGKQTLLLSLEMCSFFLRRRKLYNMTHTDNRTQSERYFVGKVLERANIESAKDMRGECRVQSAERITNLTKAIKNSCL